MEKPDIQRIRHMLVYCEEIEESISRFGDNREVFLRDKDYFRSVTMCILQIGELANGISEDFKITSSDLVPWAQIRGIHSIGEAPGISNAR